MFNSKNAVRIDMVRSKEERKKLKVGGDNNPLRVQWFHIEKESIEKVKKL